MMTWKIIRGNTTESRKLANRWKPSSASEILRIARRSNNKVVPISHYNRRG